MKIGEAMEEAYDIRQGDCREVMREMPDNSVHCCVTSPPYWGLRDYGCEGQMGLEQTPEEYVSKMVQVFRQVRRVLTDDGTLWLNLGDSYAYRGGQASPHRDSRRGGGVATGTTRSQQSYSLAGGGFERPNSITGTIKPKDLIGIPWRVAFALQADGWYLRQDIIWHKPNPMPESVRDRCTKAHEYVFLMAKSERYFYDAEAMKEPAIHAGGVVKATGPKSKNAQAGFGSDTKKGFTERDMYKGDTRNRRSVWTVTTKPFKGAHFAVMPPDLVEPCILAGCPEGGVVLDPFAGSGTVAAVAVRLRRKAIGIDLNPEYIEIARARIKHALKDKKSLSDEQEKLF